jgi:DDE superfamily endonuclease
VHCRVGEPKHPTQSKNPKYFSHKFNQAAVGYELGLSVFDNRLVWMNGPFPAADHDIKVFREKGLKEMIPVGKKIIGDNGYRGENAIIRTPNAHDPAELRKFKSRARARHESFNARVKNFRALDMQFRHGVEKHGVVFEAICVICQYQLENGSPLFDV